MPTSFSATSAARAAPPLPSKVTLPIRALASLSLVSSVAIAPTSVLAATSLPSRIISTLAAPAATARSAGAVGQRHRIELQRHGDIGAAPGGIGALLGEIGRKLGTA